MQCILPSIICMYFVCLLVYNFNSSIKFWISGFGIYINFGIFTKLLNLHEDDCIEDLTIVCYDLQLISISSMILLTPPLICFIY